MQSVGVIAAAVIIVLRPDLSIADPICTFIFSLIVMYTTVHVVKQCMNVIMEATPEDVRVEDLRVELQAIEGVVRVHDLHVWELTTGKRVLSVHLNAVNFDLAL